MPSFQIWELDHGFTNDLETFSDLFFANDQRRSEANDVLVRWFSLSDVSFCLVQEEEQFYQ